jgi:glucoamylase
VQSVPAGSVLRVQSRDPFTLHWSIDEWKKPVDTVSQTTAIGIHFVDIAVAPDHRAPILFTFLWRNDSRWEGRDYKVAVHAR